MKLFPRRRRARRLDKELGKGLWRQAHDRYVRGLNRYHQVIEGVKDDAAYSQLVLVGDELAEQLDTVYELCRKAQISHFSDGLQVPGGATKLHSSLSRAANHLATTAEAAAMVRLGHGELVAVRRRADQVKDSLKDASESAV
ncbi:hypothetical protein LTH96_08095 [Nesterenkonia sp. LB17]|nr:MULTISPECIES: hypothetical protein [unclassified Nesterenkonia]MCH8560366.1 hypothetical protein [Nesterenkonia sp. DZ6]MCH8565678.1 hypothetical protein [Nesterenkonia sp. LB17]